MCSMLSRSLLEKTAVYNCIEYIEFDRFLLQEYSHNKKPTLWELLIQKQYTFAYNCTHSIRSSFFILVALIKTFV